MKKLLIAAAALTLAASTAGLVGQSEAATAKSPYCNYAKAQKSPTAWNAYYHCTNAAPPARRVAIRTKPRHARGPTKSPFCAYARAQKNAVAWNSYYHCLNR